MRTRILLTLILLFGLDATMAQNAVEQSGAANSIILINTNNQRTRELHVGDFVKLELINSVKLKGTIMEIDSTFLTIGDRRISYDEILNFTTRKTWVRILGGGLIFSGLIISLTQSIGSVADPEPSDLTLVSIPLYGLGLALLLPDYHYIGKYMLVVVPDE